MKIITLFFITLCSISIHAQDRIVKCAAIDKLDREYSFEINVDSGAIKTIPAESPLKVLYSEAKKCGLNIGKAACSQTVQHNLDKPDQPHFEVLFNATCKSKSGAILKDLNGAAEINRFGDSYGSFKCGSLSSNELLLSNCIVL